MDEATVTIRVTPELRQWLNEVVATMMLKGRRVSHYEVLECIKEQMPVNKVVECLAKEEER